MDKQRAKAMGRGGGRWPALVENLRRRIAEIEDSRRPTGCAVGSSGCAALDRLLPSGGFRRGSLVEWLSRAGAGAETLAMILARKACQQGGALVVIDRRGEFYPPAAVRLGIEPARLLVVQPSGGADELWALDQSLRASGVAAAMAWLERLGSHDFRRLQLAAESRRVLGLLIRPGQARSEPSWADVRLQVEPLPSASAAGRRVRIDLLRSRRGIARGTVELEINEQAHPVHLVARLAGAAAPARAARA